jgi:excisionase family DNA binding protein
MSDFETAKLDPDTRQTFTVDEAARMLGISRASAFQAVHAGGLPVVRIGRRLLVPRNQLLALLGESTHNAEGAP